MTELQQEAFRAFLNRWKELILDLEPNMAEQMAWNHMRDMFSWRGLTKEDEEAIAREFNRVKEQEYPRILLVAEELGAWLPSEPDPFRLLVMAILNGFDPQGLLEPLLNGITINIIDLSLGWKEAQLLKEMLDVIEDFDDATYLIRKLFPDLLPGQLDPFS